MADATPRHHRRAVAQVAANTRWLRYYEQKAAEAAARLDAARDELTDDPSDGAA